MDNLLHVSMPSFLICKMSISWKQCNNFNELIYIYIKQKLYHSKFYVYIAFNNSEINKIKHSKKTVSIAAGGEFFHWQ